MTSLSALRLWQGGGTVDEIDAVDEVAREASAVRTTSVSRFSRSKSRFQLGLGGQAARSSGPR